MWIIQVALLLAFSAASSWALPHLYNPYHQFFRYNQPYQQPYYDGISNYAPHIQNYSPYGAPYPPQPYQTDPLATYLSQPDDLPTLNVMAELPLAVGNIFNVVPLLVMPKENLNLVENALILGASKTQPLVSVKTEHDQLIQCVPAVKIILDKPIVIYSLKTSIAFPSQIKIAHDSFHIPIKVGTVLAPVDRTVFISPDTPAYVNVVYAIPIKPVTIELANDDRDALINHETQAVVVESGDSHSGGQLPLPPKNVTIIEFPHFESEPNLEVDEEDAELVNRNPPSALIPAGIIQSTQPLVTVEEFSNPKESPFLTSLREESKKQGVKF